MDNNAVKLYEMLPNGDVSGKINGRFTGKTLSGIWQGRGKTIEKANGERVYQEGK